MNSYSRFCVYSYVAQYIFYVVQDILCLTTLIQVQNPLSIFYPYRDRGLVKNKQTATIKIILLFILYIQYTRCASVF
jgi:hypothetical protein